MSRTSRAKIAIIVSALFVSLLAFNNCGIGGSLTLSGNLSSNSIVAGSELFEFTNRVCSKIASCSASIPNCEATLPVTSLPGVAGYLGAPAQLDTLIGIQNLIDSSMLNVNVANSNACYAAVAALDCATVPTALEALETYIPQIAECQDIFEP